MGGKTFGGLCQLPGLGKTKLPRVSVADISSRWLPIRHSRLPNSFIVTCSSHSRASRTHPAPTRLSKIMIFFSSVFALTVLYTLSACPNVCQSVCLLVFSSLIADSPFKFSSTLFFQYVCLYLSFYLSLLRP